MNKPITIYELAVYRLKLDKDITSLNGGDFEKANLPMFGCARCGESLVASNMYPSKSGFIVCEHCIKGEQDIWTSVEQANKDIFDEA